MLVNLRAYEVTGAAAAGPASDEQASPCPWEPLRYNNKIYGVSRRLQGPVDGLKEVVEPLVLGLAFLGYQRHQANTQSRHGNQSVHNQNKSIF